jgi:pSer/pThr/pTyr-binding forkhead associated (FHA) protein
MPALTFEYSGARYGGTIDGRVLIGRKLTQGVVLSDPSVSRLHAWIDNRQGSFVLTDAGSRTGTFVNGEAIVRWELQNGDEIRIGPANLIFIMDDTLPEEVQELNLSARSSTVQSTKTGILFDCACGSPLWVGIELAGKRGLCKYCGEPVTVPTPPKPKIATTKKLRPAIPTKSRAKCGVCHSPVEDGEDITVCPDCLTNYHTDCWHENYGCSTYGCAQVNSLKPAAVLEEEAKAAAVPVNIEPPTKTPWEVILLAASLIGSLIGTLSFGIPAAIVTVISLVMLAKGKIGKQGVLAAAMVLSLVGIVVGLALSDFWWFAGRHLP